MLHLSLVDVLVIIILGYLIHSIYNWYRLRHIPSASFLAGFSYLWLGRTTFSGKQHWIHRDLHERLGPLIRIGPNELMTDDPEIIKRISGTNSVYKRSTWYRAIRFNPWHDHLATILEPEAHKTAKARSQPAYSGKDTPGLELCVDEQITQLLRKLQEKYAQSDHYQGKRLVDIESITSFFTLDVFMKLGFGHEAGYIECETDHYGCREHVKGLMPYLLPCADIPWLRDLIFSPIAFKLAGPKSTDQTGLGALMGDIESYVSKRFLDKEEHSRDTLESLIKHGFTQKECEIEMLVFLIAGTEIYFKLKQEVSLVVHDGTVSHPITLAETKRLPYLRSVIYEGIRMRPPLVGHFPKVVPKNGDTLGGFFVPENTNICMNLSSLLRSKALFGNDVDVFRPERFLELDLESRRKMERDVELAFGYGQWMCAGKQIASMVINKFIFEMMRSFDIQLVDPLKPCEVANYGAFYEDNLRISLSKDLTCPIV